MALLKKWLTTVALSALLVGASVQAKEVKKVGVTVGDLSNPFFVLIGKGAEQKAHELGGEDVKVTLVSSGYDLGRQVNQIDNFIAAGVDLIILGAADSKGIFPAVKRAQQAGIKVVAVDVDAMGADATVTADNLQAGHDACQYIVDRLDGKGDVIVINGQPVSSIQDRVKGCLNVRNDNPGINILSDNQNGKNSRDGGFEVMTSLLAAYPHVDAVFGVNDPTAIGADLAARQARRDEFFIVGVDGSPDGEEALKSDNSLFVATPAQNPMEQSEKAVEIGFDLVAGKPGPKETVRIPMKMIDADNVDDYVGWNELNKQ